MHKDTADRHPAPHQNGSLIGGFSAESTSLIVRDGKSFKSTLDD
jgi:hypothetical protein